MSYSSEVLADAPLAYWRLGELSGAALTDSSGNGRNGSYVGSPGLGAAGLLATSADKSVNFDGVDDRATVASASWMDVSSFTLEAWVRLDTIPASGVAPIVYRLNYFPSTPGIALNVTSAGKVRCDLQTPAPASYTATGATTLAPGTTYHVVGTYDGSTLRVYVNGVLDGSAAATGSPGAIARDLHVGAREANTAGTAFNYADGRIDEVAFYGAALSATRITAHYTAGTTAPPPPAGTLAATLPALSASLSGVYAAPPATGALTATLPALAVNLSGAYDGPTPPVVGDLAATLPPLSASLAGTYAAPPVVVDTSTKYANDGYNYDGMAAVYNDPAVAPTPAHIPRAKVLQVHQSMSAPVLVNGRPT